MIDLEFGLVNSLINIAHLASKEPHRSSHSSTEVDMLRAVQQWLHHNHRNAITKIHTTTECPRLQSIKVQMVVADDNSGVTSARISNLGARHFLVAGLSPDGLHCDGISKNKCPRVIIDHNDCARHSSQKVNCVHRRRFRDAGSNGIAKAKPNLG